MSTDTPEDYLETEIARYFPDSTAVRVTYHSDQTISAEVEGTRMGERYYLNLWMEITSEDEWYRFHCAERDNKLLITIPFQPQEDEEFEDLRPEYGGP